MAGSGSTTVDFGAFPGCSEASVDVSGQSGLISSSLVEAWLLPIATGDHGVDDHVAESEGMGVIGRYKVDGTLTITAYARQRPQLADRIFTGSREDSSQTIPILFGQYTVGWVWT